MAPAFPILPSPPVRGLQLLRWPGLQSHGEVLQGAGPGRSVGLLRRVQQDRGTSASGVRRDRGCRGRFMGSQLLSDRASCRLCSLSHGAGARELNTNSPRTSQATSRTRARSSRSRFQTSSLEHVLSSSASRWTLRTCAKPQMARPLGSDSPAKGNQTLRNEWTRTDVYSSGTEEGAMSSMRVGNGDRAT